MKVGVAWLREWASPRATDAQLAQRLTMAGLECAVEPAAAALPKIVVGAIVDVQPHPQADRLRVCAVDVGAKERLTIVCGAANARAGMKAPTALVGAKLPEGPHGVEIRKAALRGVESAGMLCSAKELGLAEKSDGLLELDAGARIGQAIGEHLALGDATLALELTPNRGDCLSVLGLAREVSAIYGVPLKRPPMKPVKPAGSARVDVKVASRADCPRYAGRVIDGIDAAARTPDWMRERLRRSGIRSISAVVDVTNYVMLELGQPMHAFDASHLHDRIVVRRAQPGESLKLLNEQTYSFDGSDLLIADAAGPLALAGVMGGAPSGVTVQTTRIFLESACFEAGRVAATGRRLRIPSDALYRFERGVDPTVQRLALERASELIVALCGGVAGPVTDVGVKTRPVTVKLRRARLDQLLGHEIPSADAERFLKRLGLAVRRIGKTGWQATVPPHRYDLRLEVDLIEEVARLYGYDRIPARPYAAGLAPAPVAEMQPLDVARQRLIARGYQEAITYSFVDAALQQQLAPDVPAIPLDNPIADTLAHMRTTLWSGLIPAWRYNQQRQRKRVRFFEIGVCFTLRGSGEVVETERLAMLAAGGAAPEQWGLPARPVDFHDVKADLTALMGRADGLRYEPALHPALHPGQSARLWRGQNAMGWMGRMHPRLVAALDLPEAPILLEMDAVALRGHDLPKLHAPSEFPESRRDLAVVLPETVTGETLLANAREAGGPLLRETGVFDVYRGAALPNGFKSVALSLIFQDNSRTLTDEEVDTAVQAVAHRLQASLGASIRGDDSGGVDQGGAGRSAV
jgi:phenylalanyl-tRNA synthetase beta chain